MYNYTYIHITNELAIITNDLIDKSINHLAHELIDKPSSKPKCMSISKLKLNKKPKPQAGRKWLDSFTGHKRNGVQNPKTKNLHNKFNCPIFHLLIAQAQSKFKNENNCTLLWILTHL